MKYIKPTLVLAAICIIISAALAVTYNITKSSAELTPDKILAQMSDDYKSVLPGATAFEFIERTPDYENNKNGVAVEWVKSDAGYAITAHSSGQYDSTPIRVLVGISYEGQVTGVKILRISETPGMGQRVNSKSFLSQFAGGIKFSADGRTGKKIDTLTNATYSSKAVISAVNTALEKFAELTDNKGASST